jgi:CRISPR-associated protein Cas1
MIKRTLLIENPAYLSTKYEQLVIELKNENQEKHTLPMSEIGVVILSHPQITITSQAKILLMQNNVVLIQCGTNGMPIGMMLPFDGHYTFSQNVRHQVEASQALKKQLWQQTIQAKILNQAKLLEKYDIASFPLRNYAQNVYSGDKDNKEAHAANFYWSKIFPEIPDFIRERGGLYPNNLLNYGYAILRAVTARALVSSGLLLVLGIFHRNKYNAFCLADDIMEPYRIFVDEIVKKRVTLEFLNKQFSLELTKQIKMEILNILTTDVHIDDETSPLFNALQKSANSLLRCYKGEKRKLLYPDFQ